MAYAIIGLMMWRITKKRPLFAAAKWKISGDEVRAVDSLSCERRAASDVPHRVTASESDGTLGHA
jgi:hypothetical protein